MDISRLYGELEAIFNKMVEFRRDLHQYPELSFKEKRTPMRIADYLRDLGLEVRTGVGGRGVVGLLQGGKEGKTVGLRADFDALPIQDEKEISYKSLVPGVMHACGHDGHTATLLGVATVLANHREELEGNVVFIHQFAEEIVPGGAKAMIEDGCLDGVDMIFGNHLQSMLPSGEVYYREGPIQAALDKFDIKVIGKGGHGGVPHETIDPIVTASQLVVNLQQIVSRRVNPVKAAVLSIGSFNSGDSFNIIPNTVEISGTVRSFDLEVRSMIEEKMEQIALATCQANDATCEFNYERGYDPVWNHPKETQYIRKVAEEVVGEERVKETPPVMPGEDFAYYLQNVPGTFFHTGAMPSDSDRVYPHHHARFDFDEKAMLVAAKVFVSAIVRLHKSNLVGNSHNYRGV